MDRDTNNKGGIHLSQESPITANENGRGALYDWERIPTEPEVEIEENIYKTPDLGGETVGDVYKKLIQIFGIVDYIVLALLVAACVLVLVSPLDAFSGQWIILLAAYVISGVWFTIDAVVINRVYNRNRTLYIFAWIFQFVYPFRRDTHLMRKSNLVTILLSAAVVLSFAGIGVKTFFFQKTYKAVYMVDGKQEREAMEHLLNQDADGVILAKQLNQAFRVTGAAVNNTGSISKIVLIGEGCYQVDPALENADDVSWNIKQMLFQDQGSYSVPTQLIFIKSEDNSDYRLSTVKFGDKALLPSYIYNYWRKVILRWDEMGNRQE